jgi:branched-subunit amino acid aminotransferase/4-amino-4-deoxychorismate lyase
MILNGITRQAVLRIAASRDIEILEKPFSLERVFQEGKEAFLTSTTKRILPVTTINNKHLGQVGPITGALIKAYNNYLHHHASRR